MSSSHAFKNTLLVEDDLNLAQAIELSLAEMKISVERVSTLADARERIFEADLETPPIDLVVLDRQLPDGDGLDLCKQLRSGGFAGMVLVLTAMGETHQRVAGLDVGADDYLAKPFSWEELSARINALARRHSPAAATAALWMRDPERVRIRATKGWVTLTPLEFKLATHLIEAAGKVVSRDELLRQVWGFQLLPKTRTVDYFMRRLRKHFEEDPDAPKYFLTVRGAGYRFVDGTAKVDD